MLKALCFGNPHVREDLIALIMADNIRIPEIELIKCNSPENIAEFKQNPLIILDAVKGIKKVTKITDLNQLSNRKIISMHDFDLQFHLKMLQSMGDLKDIIIIGIPYDMNPQDAEPQVITMLKKITQEL